RAAAPARPRTCRTREGKRGTAGGGAGRRARDGVTRTRTGPTGPAGRPRMNPLMISILVGGLVIPMGVVLFLAPRKNTGEAASDRLDALVGRNLRKDSSADMLLKQALQEADKQSLLDRLTPGFFNLTKTFEQADCNIKPSALFGISLGLAVLGAALCVWLVNLYVVPLGAGLCFVPPRGWL